MQKLSRLKTNNNKVKIRLAQIKDLKFTFEIYNENILKKKFFSKKKITFKEHELWFKKKIKEKMLFICSYRVRVGYIRYDDLKNKKLSISIAVKDKYKRHGFGRLMLKKTLNHKRIVNKNIFAFVKKHNFSSKKFFSDFGFKKIKSNTYLMKSK